MSPAGGWQADLPGVRETAEEWVTGVAVDRSGAAAYAHLVRSPLDPERKTGVQSDKRPHLTFNKVAVEDLAAAMLAHLGDGVARTFNRIGVELWDKTADVLFDGNVDDALWLLVERGELEHTYAIPILFRRRRKP